MPNHSLEGVDGLASRVQSLHGMTDAMREAEKRRHRMELYQRFGLFGELPNGVTVARAVTLADLAEALQLVHGVFVGCGYITPQAGGIRNRGVDLLPTTNTGVARAGGKKIVGVISLAIDDPAIGLPSDEEFKKELDCLRGRSKVVCEVTNYAVAPDFRRTSVPTELMRYCLISAAHIRCTDLVATVSPTHAGFYEFLGFRIVSQTRSYSVLVFDPVQVLDLDLGTIESGGDETKRFVLEYFIRKNPYRRVAV